MALQASSLRVAIAGLLATAGFGALAVTGAAPGASAQLIGGSHSASTVAYVPHVLPNGNIPTPPWWHGRCDGASTGTYPGSNSLGAAWDGLTACGPGPNEGGLDHLISFFPGAWGEYEWECVELSMRWMYLAWGVPPYGANGDDIADNYAADNPDGPRLDVVQNGTPGDAPQPGDVLELDDGDAFGHTEVVTSSAVNVHGDGRVEVITENLNSPTNGWYSLTVTNWVVDGGFGTVVDWLHNPKWALEEPLVSELSSTGELSVKVDAVRGHFTDVQSGVAQAEVIGGGGPEPAPILVVLTTAGVVEARYDLPSAPWWQLGTGATSIAASSGEGRRGGPVIGWLTGAGDFYTVTGGFSAAPVLEARGVASIAVASDSPTAAPMIGYVTPREVAYLKVGSAAAVRLAVGVRTLTLADDGVTGTSAAATASASHAVEAYIGVAGRAFVRVGLVGHFTEIGPTAKDSVSQVAVATVGQTALPLVAYLTTTGDAYAENGISGWIHERSGASAIDVAAGHNANAFPIFAVERTGASGAWDVKEGTLSAKYVSEGAATALGLGALVVS